VHFLSRFVKWRGCRPMTTPQSTGGSINRLQIDLESLIRSKEPASIAVDSSGVKVHNTGDWIRKVWKVKKGYLKIHFAVDVKTGQVVSMDVSSEKVGDGKRRLKRLVKRAEERVRVKRVLAEGAHDSKANFNFLTQEGIKPVIRVRKGSVPRSRGSRVRKLAVIEQQADVQAEGVEQHTQVRVQVEGRRGVLRHKEGLRGIRHCKEVRQHGKGDGDEGLDLQRVHQGDGVGPKRRPAVTMLVMDSCNRAAYS
jgi:hypothetical protein